MKYCRFQLGSRPQYGLVETVAGREEITRLLVNAPEDSNGDMEDVPTKRMEPVALAEAALLAPVRPSKIVCVGKNYAAHVAEMIAVKSGLGYVLWDAYYVGRMDICVATMFSVGLLGFVSDQIILRTSQVVLRWRTLERHA